MKKIWLWVAALALCCCLSAGLRVSAESADGAVPEDPAAAGAEAAAETTGQPDSEPDGTSAQNTADRSFGAVLLSVLDAHASELLSALTLVASLVLAHAYKKGLVPTLWGGLNSIARTVQDTGEQTRLLAETAQKSIDGVSQSAAPLLEQVEVLCGTAEETARQNAQLKSLIAQTETDRARMVTFMQGLAGMLYEVFSVANLPQYAKEQLGRTYTAIMAQAEGDRHENTDCDPTV